MRAKRVVITGAAGNVGAKLRAHLIAAGGYDLVLIDRDARGDKAIVEADLGVLDRRWTDLCTGAEAIVHLAANADSSAAWSDLIDSNIVATVNVYRAAAAHKVARVVYASSVWAMAQRRGDAAPIAEGPAAPGDNAYGASKAIGERIGQAFAESDGVETVVIRLGACPPGENAPWPMNAWDDSCWVSNRDLCQGFTRALEAQTGKFLIVNLTSDNPARRWSLSNARDILGYTPRDRFAPSKKPGRLSRIARKFALLLKRQYRRTVVL